MRLSSAKNMLTRTAGLVRHVDVEPQAGAFVGRSVDLGWGRVYGGQTMAQGLAACQRQAPRRAIHHFSCLFLRGGRVDRDMRFEATALTSGRSFSAVQGQALQDGEPVLAMTASLQTPETGMEHQEVAALRPEWGRPDELRSWDEHMAPFLDRVPQKLRALHEAQPVEFRPAEFVAPWDTTIRPPHRAFWVRMREALPDDPQVHERLLTYISDWAMLETSLMPHPTAFTRPEMQMASLSHSVYFHQPFRLDRQWLCHAMHSPVSSGGRGLTLGEFWTEDGVLVASTAQEGLIRRKAMPGPA
eukprot:5725751-Prymnesium_polylepis.1